MKKGLRLLLVLADHLETGKLSVEVFSYSNFRVDNTVNKSYIRGLPEDFCGTAGCAAGELACLFPDQWDNCKSNNTGPFYPKLKGNSPKNGPFEDLSIFFEITGGEAWYLFAPYSEEADFTKEQVAAKIRKFVAEKQDK